MGLAENKKPSFKDCEVQDLSTNSRRYERLRYLSKDVVTPEYKHQDSVCLASSH